jgi:hypothetical protein
VNESNALLDAVGVVAEFVAPVAAVLKVLVTVSVYIVSRSVIERSYVLIFYLFL